MSYYQKAISKKCTEEILIQMERSFCKIEGKDNQFGFGFFCFIKNQNKKIPVLITKGNININENDIVNISLNDINIEIKVEDIIYENKEDKITIIEIEENVNNDINYLEFDDRMYGKEPEMFYHKELIYIIQYID